MYTGGTFEDVGGGGSSEGEGGEVDSEFGSAPPAPDDATWTIDSIIGGGVPQVRPQVRERRAPQAKGGFLSTCHGFFLGGGGALCSGSGRHSSKFQR